MATVYKVELELVSFWVNFTPEEIQEAIKVVIENHTYPILKAQEVRVDNIKVERKS